jgi:CRISPR-associated protein Csm5
MRYSVTALTPLLVGDGRELSPIDYMVWKDQVNVLDQNRIFKLLARGPRLEGYLNQLRKASKLDFASWGGFAQNFSLRRIPFEHPDSTAIWNAAPSEFLFVPTFAANLRGPYLPATSIKGALRTGLIFSRWNSSTIGRLASTLDQERSVRRATEAAENSVDARQLRLFSAADTDAPTSGLFKIFLTRTASLNRTPDGKTQLAWKVAGRGSVPSSRVADATPTFVEMALPNTTFAGTWEERTFLSNTSLSRQALLESANEYARLQLELHQTFAAAGGLAALQASIERLKTALSSTRENPNSCLLCLGWGGGFVSKSGYLATDDPAFRKILRAVPSFSRALREGAPFPKTRRIVFSGGQPTFLPGWVRMEIHG